MSENKLFIIVIVIVIKANGYSRHHHEPHSEISASTAAFLLGIACYDTQHQSTQTFKIDLWHKLEMIQLIVFLLELKGENGSSLIPYHTLPIITSICIKLPWAKCILKLNGIISIH